MGFEHRGDHSAFLCLPPLSSEVRLHGCMCGDELGPMEIRGAAQWRELRELRAVPAYRSDFFPRDGLQDTAGER